MKLLLDNTTRIQCTQIAALMSSVPYYKVNNERLYLKEVNEGEETT